MSTLIPLENVRIASPCRAEWSLMEGDDRVRFCQSCAKNVYNLSSMSKGDAEKLLQEKEGKLCVRYYQRADGTVLSADCPVGVKIVRRPFQWLAAGFAALLASGVAIATQGGNAPAIGNGPTFDVRDNAFVRMIIDRIEGRDNVTMGSPPAMMGMMVCPAPAPAPTPTPTPKPKE